MSTPDRKTERRDRDRNRRLMKKINDEEAAWHRQIREKMDAGMTFDEAWILCGGTFGPVDAFGFVRPFRRIWPPEQ